MRLIRTLTVWLALLPLPAAAVNDLALDLGALTVGGWQLRDVRATVHLGGTGPPGPAHLSVARVTGPGGRPALSDVEITCTALEMTARAVNCRDGGGTATIPGLGARHFSLSLAVDRVRGSVSLTVEGLSAAGGHLEGTLSTTGSQWQADVTADAVKAETLASFWAASPVTFSHGGLTARVHLEGSGSELARLDADVTADGLSFSDQPGLHAGEGLGGYLSAGLRRTGSGWSGRLEARLQSGQLYVDPVFTDLGAHPASISTGVTMTGDFASLRLSGSHLVQDGVVTARGAADLGLFPFRLRNLGVASFHATLPAAYSTYLQPYAVGTPAGDLKTSGALEGQISVAAGRLAAIALTVDNASLGGAASPFAVQGLTGDLYWTDADRKAPPTTDLRWKGGRLYGIDVGTGGVELALHAGDVTLRKPARVPLLDGALSINRLELRDIGGERMQAALDARLEPIGMARLTRALGLPRFSGSLSGRIPQLAYRDGTLSLGGTLQADVFGGRVSFEDLRLDNPFGNVPELDTTIHLRGLDLETVTTAFSFGRITGSLDGDIEGLRLVRWRPAAFDAWFHTPANDPIRHRISQRAVQNLAEIGGSGAAAALSRGFLQFFDAFSYDRIGIGCRLSGTVCRMRGLAPADGGGYYIVRGSGLPRVDVIGHSTDVSWPTLVEQIVSATAAGAPVVQ